MLRGIGITGVESMNGSRMIRNSGVVTGKEERRSSRGRGRGGERIVHVAATYGLASRNYPLPIGRGGTR